ncbi:Uncharacterized protein HZ326_20816 [Fusarium oxysporum f. sp. albedinis]|nr:Uncharacterized protein HZ326_20816 [Fusarium oxysporum f. sp. albedinis]
MLRVSSGQPRLRRSISAWSSYTNLHTTRGHSVLALIPISEHVRVYSCVLTSRRTRSVQQEYPTQKIEPINILLLLIMNDPTFNPF